MGLGPSVSWRQRGAVLSGKKNELFQAVSEDFDILGHTSMTMLRVGFANMTCWV